MTTTTTASTAAPNVNMITDAKKVITEASVMRPDAVWHDWIIPYGTKIVMAIVIYVVGHMMAKWLSKLLGRAAFFSSKDEMLQSFVTSISYFSFLLIVIIAMLSQLGINTSSLVALIGAAGLAIGLALQNSLQNFAAGVMLLIFKPFQKGDVIETNSRTGKVHRMGILMLELHTSDNKTILIPNGTVFSSNIVNYSANITRRVELALSVAGETDFAQAKALLLQLISTESAVLKTPEPSVVISGIVEGNVQIVVHVWAKREDYMEVEAALWEKTKAAFDQAKISFA